MSRDSVLYRSLAYIDTNLCPPQAVLCICHVHIPIPPSLSILLLPISFPPSPFRHPLSLPPSIRDRPPLSTSLLVPLYASNRSPPRSPSSLNVPVDPAASCSLSRSRRLRWRIPGMHTQTKFEAVCRRVSLSVSVRR